MQDTDEPSAVIGPIFERMVERALDLPEIATATGSAEAGPSRERLRAEALEARDRLTGVAACEYDHYRTLRTAARVDGTRQDADRTTKSGFLPVLALLVPSLGAVATGAFLLCGFGLRAFAARPHIDDGLVMAGVIAAAVTAGAALGDLGWLLVNRARRRRPGSDDPVDRDPGVRRAREAFECAVLERGLVPFLLERVPPGLVEHECGHEGSGGGRRVDEGRAVGTEERVR
ncbi:hypothetical protein [Streptomyces hygroscopicus]|uniref:hypothetical protein n=1 Tax=Streptomyces hygroscopicus TaxID=1912 RepID=UPI0022404C39|nr:hypothetical protein [Streptomyces hygroscopicus]